MSAQTNAQNDPSLQRFTATGRPMPNPKDSSRGFGLNAMNGSDSWGTAAPNLLPVRFTDDSIISIPVLAPQSIGSGYADSNDSSSSLGLIKETKKQSKFGLFSRRKSEKPSELEFVMKDMPRSEYLKHYAKEDNGKYIGTEDPAQDCILRDEGDRARYRSTLHYSSSIPPYQKE